LPEWAYVDGELDKIRSRAIEMDKDGYIVPEK